MTITITVTDLPDGSYDCRMEPNVLPQGTIPTSACFAAKFMVEALYRESQNQQIRNAKLEKKKSRFSKQYPPSNN